MIFPKKVLRFVDWHYFSLYSTFTCPRFILFSPHFYLSLIYYLFIIQLPCRSWRTSPKCSYLYLAKEQHHLSKNSFPLGSRCQNGSSWSEFPPILAKTRQSTAYHLNRPCSKNVLSCCFLPASYCLGHPTAKDNQQKIIKSEYVTGPMRRLETWCEPYSKRTWGDRQKEEKRLKKSCQAIKFQY